MTVEQTAHPQDTTATPAGAEDTRDNGGDKGGYTPDEVERIVVDRLKRAERSWARKYGSKKEQAEPEAPSVDLAAELAELKLLRQFDRAVAGIQLAPAKRDALEKLFRADRPEDPTGWAKETADAFGWLEAPKAEPTTKAQTLPAGEKLATEQTAPSTAKGYTEADDPLQWDQDTVAKILREKGATEGRKWLRKKFEEAMRERRIIRG